VVVARAENFLTFSRPKRTKARRRLDASDHRADLPGITKNLGAEGEDGRAGDRQFTGVKFYISTLNVIMQEADHRRGNPLLAKGYSVNFIMAFLDPGPKENQLLTAVFNLFIAKPNPAGSKTTERSEKAEPN
jgi:hypothetical protein